MQTHLTSLAVPTGFLANAALTATSARQHPALVGFSPSPMAQAPVRDSFGATHNAEGCKDPKCTEGHTTKTLSSGEGSLDKAVKKATQPKAEKT